MSLELAAIRVDMRVTAVGAARGATTAPEVLSLRAVHPPRAAVHQRRWEPLGGAPKRVFDIVASVIGLVLLAPLLVTIAAIVRLETAGPALFCQRRRGYCGRTFLIRKFRTMRTMDDSSAIVQAQTCDPRITRFGAFLRKTSIDELPQLINVLVGEMSIVGPRPHAVAHDAEFSSLLPYYRVRQRARPGITGLAQVSGCRGETKDIESVRNRTQFDLKYIAEWSLRNDLRIILSTIKNEWRGGV